MEKLFLIGLASLFLLSCEINGPFDHIVTFSVDDIKKDGELETATKTSLQDGSSFVWSTNDTVGIYPNTGGQIYFAMTAGAGAKNASFDGGGWDFKSSATYYSYYPFIADVYLNRNKIPVSYIGQCQRGANDVSHIGAYDFMYTGPTSAENACLNFKYSHLGCIIRIRLTLPAGTYLHVILSTDEPSFVSKGYYNLESDSPEIIPTELSSNLVVSLKDVVLSEQTQFFVYAMSAPVSLKGKNVRVRVLDSEGYEYFIDKTPSSNYVSGTIYGLSCTSMNKRSSDADITIGGNDGDKLDDDDENIII